MKDRKRENAQLAQSAISGFGMCSQRAGAEIGAGPDLYTARQVLEPSIGTLLARYRKRGRFQAKNAYSYEYALLAKY